MVLRGGGTNRSGIQFLASSSQPVRVDETATETNTIPAPLTSATGAGGEDRSKERRTEGEGEFAVGSEV